MKRIKKVVTAIVLVILLTTVCGEQNVYASDAIAYGADIGWMSQLEGKGITWVDSDGNQTDPLLLLKNKGVDAVRIRAFVNPPSSFQWTKSSGVTVDLGYCDTQGVLYTAQRARNLGMKIMIDFHYSDVFADPLIQEIPSQWEDATAEQLQQYVYDYTYYVMNELKKLGIYPEWVQVGNEINSGILHPYGKASTNFEQLVAYLNSGYDAVKAVSPNSKVVTQLANGHQLSRFTYFFDKFLGTYNGKTDVIGVSYYPYWAGDRVIKDLSYSLNYLATRYDKEVMICETGDEEDEPELTFDLLQKEITAMATVANGKGAGIFYWEPEIHSSSSPEEYALGATEKINDTTYKFTSALDAFLDEPVFLNGNNTFAIINCNSEKVLNVQNGSTNNSAIIEQYDFDNWDSQEWYFEKVDDSYYKIVNKRSGKVLDVNGISTDSGASIIQYEYNEGWNQMWDITADSDGQYKIKNRWSGLYLGISDASTADGAACVQLSESSSDNINWYFIVTE
jgi:arabinogalactan endo-1,4-beta-galactosidase